MDSRCSITLGLIIMEPTIIIRTTKQGLAECPPTAVPVKNKEYHTTKSELTSIPKQYGLADMWPATGMAPHCGYAVTSVW